jgi:hypothetical protein
MARRTDWRSDGRHKTAHRLNAFVGALRDVGIQPGDTITPEDWSRAELVAFGTLDPGQLRNYRRALEAFEVIEQLGGKRRGVHVQGFRIKNLPAEPLIPTAA